MTMTETRKSGTRIAALESLIEHLSAEVGRLHRELADFRAELATEVKTQRLVVIDDEGRERITSRISGTWTSFTVRSAGLDDIAPGWPNDPTVTLSTGGSGDTRLSGGMKQVSEAQVECSTGDDSYAVLTQITGRKDNHVQNWGELWMFDQHAYLYGNGEERLDQLNETVLDRHGMYYQTHTGTVHSYAQMVRPTPIEPR